MVHTRLTSENMMERRAGNPHICGLKYFSWIVLFSSVFQVRGSRDEQNYEKKIEVSNGGHLAEWGAAEYCEKGSYAVGYKMKIDATSALNGINLLCEFPGGGCGGSLTSTVGPRGSWTGHITCGSNRVLTAFRLQVDEPRGYFLGTAANFLQLKCRDFYGLIPEYVFALSPGIGRWGQYGEWSESCRPGTGICGLSTRVQADCGSCGNNTALNDVKFYCCD